MIAFRSVSHRLIAWVLGATATLFLAVSWYEYQAAQIIISQQIKSKAELAEADLVNRLNNLLHNVSESVQTSAGVLSVARPDQQRLQQLMQTILFEHPTIFGMAVALEPQHSIDPGYAPYFYRDGDRLRYRNLAADNYRYRQQNWYQQTMRQRRAIWSEPYVDKNGGDIAMVTYSVPIFLRYDQHAALVGVVTADIALSTLNELVSSLAVGETGFAYLFSHRGNIITHTQPERVMQNINALPAMADGSHRLAPALDNMLQGGSGKQQIPCTSAPQSQACWLSYQPVKNTNWSIAVVIPMQELASTLEIYRYTSLTITVCGLLLLTFIVVAISRRVTVPLLALTHSSAALARGELNTPIQDFGLNDEVGKLARQFRLMQQQLKTYIEQLQSETAQRERYEGELQAAHSIQMQMLPDHGHSQLQHHRLQLAARLQPAKSVGGDFYDYQWLNSGQQLFFCVGDVSDKGIAAALYMAKTQTLLRHGCQQNDNLPALLADINNQLCHNNESCMFVTLLCGLLDIQTGQLQLASAGHHPPLALKPNQTAPQVINGPALGLFENSQYQASRYLLAKGEGLVLSTDGVEEATNPAEDFYGLARFTTAIAKWHSCDSAELLEKLYGDIIDFRAEAAPSDDLTLMILQRAND